MRGFSSGRAHLMLEVETTIARWRVFRSAAVDSKWRTTHCKYEWERWFLWLCIKVIGFYIWIKSCFGYSCSHACISYFNYSSAQLRILLTIEDYYSCQLKNTLKISKILQKFGKKTIPVNLKMFLILGNKNTPIMSKCSRYIMFRKLLQPTWKITPNIIREILSSNMEYYACVLTFNYYPLCLSQIEKYLSIFE